MVDEKKESETAKEKEDVYGKAKYGSATYVDGERKVQQ